MSQVFWDVKPCPLVNIYWRFIVERFTKRSWIAWALKCTAPTFADFVGKYTNRQDATIKRLKYTATKL